MTSSRTKVPIRLLDWSRLRTELLWAYEGSPLMQHVHATEVDTVMCWLILQGTVHVQGADSGNMTAQAGQWLFLAKDKIAHDFSDDAKIISLRLVIHWPSKQPLYDHNQWICFESSEHPQLKRQARVLTKHANKIIEQSQSPDPIHTELSVADCDLSDYLALENATLRWVHFYNRAMQKIGIERLAATPIDIRVSRCLKHIEQLAPNHQFDEKQLARTLGLSVSQLNRIFIAALNCTPKAYAENLRLNETIKLLTSTNMPLKQLAYLIGFKQSSHFANWFLKKTGQYPKTYRQWLKNPGHKQIIQALKSW